MPGSEFVFYLLSHGRIPASAAYLGTRLALAPEDPLPGVETYLLLYKLALVDCGEGVGLRLLALQASVMRSGNVRDPNYYDEGHGYWPMKLNVDNVSE